jgi:hypothetical protein
MNSIGVLTNKESFFLFNDQATTNNTFFIKHLRKTPNKLNKFYILLLSILVWVKMALENILNIPTRMAAIVSV